VIPSGLDREIKRSYRIVLATPRERRGCGESDGGGK